MGVHCSGYYKWRARLVHKNRYEINRELLTEMLKEQHKKYPSHGYHQLAADVFDNTGWIFSDHLAHKCCQFAGIHSKARKSKYQKPGENVKFANLVQGHWDAKAPLQLVV